LTGCRHTRKHEGSIKPIRTSWKDSMARRLEAQIREIGEAFETQTDESTTAVDAADRFEFEFDDPSLSEL
jgi:hypothetical protein